MKLFSKEDLIKKIKAIGKAGWHESVKKTVNFRNDGAVGNTLEVLLGVEENNLPIPNANEWELKGQRSHSKSLITLKHIEPSPTAVKFVSSLFLPKYGWSHKEAGKKYSANEMSFRSTTFAKEFTARGFKLLIDRNEEKIKFVFDSKKADISKKEILEWIKVVEQRVGLKQLNPEPYWGFRDLQNTLGAKLKNCFYVIADSKNENGHEYFWYKKLLILSDFSFSNLLDCFEEGSAYIDFDARTGHNHGTKIRLKQACIPKVFAHSKEIDLLS